MPLCRPPCGACSLVASSAQIVLVGARKSCRTANAGQGIIRWPPIQCAWPKVGGWLVGLPPCLSEPNPYRYCTPTSSCARTSKHSRRSTGRPWNADSTTHDVRLFGADPLPIPACDTARKSIGHRPARPHTTSYSAGWKRRLTELHAFDQFPQLHTSAQSQSPNVQKTPEVRSCFPSSKSSFHDRPTVWLSFMI